MMSLDELSRQSTLEAPETLDIPIGLVQNPRTRNRSNSKVYGKSSSSPQTRSPPLPSLSVPSHQFQQKNLIIPKPQKPQSQPQIMTSNTNGQISSITNGVKPSSSTNNNTPSTVPDRTKIIFLLIATSLNETFDRKTLSVPEYPNVLKLGRPNSSQKAPHTTNGYFDSRVISREHAELYVKEGKVFIKDCNSSNGTFVNDEKLLKERELSMEDVVNLGVDIDNDKNKHQHHRKISLFIENILTIPIEEGVDSSVLVQEALKKNDRSSRNQDSQLSSLDAALFGDINGELEDISTGVEEDLLGGIFVNNSIGTNTTLIQTVKNLITQIHMENLNNMKLASIENFLQNYKSEISKNEHITSLAKVKKESENYKNKAQEYERELQNLKKSNDEKDNLINKTKSIISQKEHNILDLQHAVQSLEKSTQNERNKISTLIINYEEEIKALKQELKDKEQLIDDFKDFKNQYKQERLQLGLSQDMYGLFVIVSSVMILGVVALWRR